MTNHVAANFIKLSHEYSTESFTHSHNHPLTLFSQTLFNHLYFFHPILFFITIQPFYFFFSFVNVFDMDQSMQLNLVK